MLQGGAMEWFAVHRFGVFQGEVVKRAILGRVATPLRCVGRSQTSLLCFQEAE